MADKRTFRLRTHEGEEHIAYLELRDHPHELVRGLVNRTVDLHPLIENYHGPRLTLDFDDQNRPVGIEIIYPSDDDDDEDTGQV
jgi:hypothetical protein